MKSRNKKVLSSQKRELLLFGERILSVILAISVTLIFINSFFCFSTSYGTTYYYAVSPLDKEKSFEEREIFQSLLLGNIEQITRYVVICHQLETRGSYDANKHIDITRYANRAKEVTQEHPAAQYYLDDLITWGNYGFTYKTVMGTWEELNGLFAQEGQEKQNTSIKEYAGTIEENEERLQAESTGADLYAMEILIPRYETVDGKDLLQCAENAEEYEILKNNLKISAESLFSNYTEYVAMEEKYSLEHTNIRYCFQIPSDHGLTYYTNTDLKFSGKSADDITALVKEQEGKFLYFNPDKVQINTNTDISAKQMRNVLKEHQYTFGDDTRVWIWVDTSYPSEDSLKMVKEELDSFRPYYLTFWGVSAAALAMAIGILCFLTYKEGRLADGKQFLGYGIQKQDTFPLEVWMLLAVSIEVFFAKYSWQLFYGYRNGRVSYRLMPVIFGAVVFVMNEVGVRFYFSVVRRIKAKEVWKTTLIYKILKETKRILLQTISQGDLLTRTWIPYLIFLILNLILVLLGVGGVIGAFLLDMLVGVYLYHDCRQREKIVDGIEIIKNGDSKYRIDTTHLHGENLRLAESVNSIGMGIRNAVESSMKDEKLKTDLITNVSHDIKTPLTSIITYVDLLKRENIRDERILGYIRVLDSKSQRLKLLIDDLVEASKISSGNITICLETINFAELVKQAIGEFGEKFADSHLQVITKMPEKAMLIHADSGQLWRVMENLFSNAAKYALPGTRVYMEMEEAEGKYGKENIFSVKNISAGYLEVEAEELTERFIRGDRSRKTEGSGLGLSIAKNLIEAQGGEFDIQVDGDLFKAIIRFPAAVVKEP